MLKKSLKKYLFDYNRASKNYYSDTWKETSSQNLNFFIKKDLSNILINNNIRGLAPIDNFPSGDFLNKKNILELNKLQKKEYFKIYKKNKYLNYNFGSAYLIAYRYFTKIKKYLKKKSKVLIIGDGLGILSSMIFKTFKCKIYLCDLPETLIYQQYFISKNFNNINYQYIANSKDKLDFSKNFFFINAKELNRLKIDLDLAINTDSFCEMDKVSVDNYFKYISDNLKKNGKFFYCNPIGLSGKGYNKPGDYPLGNIFKIDDIEVLYPSHRDTFCKYLAVSCSKKFLKEKIQNSKISLIRKKILNKYYDQTERIVTKIDINKIKKLSIEISNSILKNEFAQKIKKKINILNGLYNSKQNIVSKKLNYNIFYHYFFCELSNLIEKNDKKNNKRIEFLRKKINKNPLHNSSLIKLISLSRFKDSKLSLSFLDNIEENSFEIIFLKFCSFENLNQKKQVELFNKIKNYKNLYFYDHLKLLYCSHKIGDYYQFDKIYKILFQKIQNKDESLNLLKLIFNLGKFKIFEDTFDKLKKKFDLTNQDKANILLSTNFVKVSSRNRFKSFFKDEKFFNVDNLDRLILNFKTNNINESTFISRVMKKTKNYYSIGYVLKNTLNELSYKNLKKMAAKSLQLRPNVQNINFISEIYFFNSLYKECFQTLNTIKNVDNYSIYYGLKRKLSKVALQNETNFRLIKRNTSCDFFKPIHNGRVVMIPFLCTGNNAVQINNN